jgi:molybdopterin synthase sulfur carrier subunit
MITILYFASLREQLNKTSEQLTCPDGVSTVGDLRDWLCQRGAPWSQVLDAKALVMMSVNHSMTDALSVISDGDEIAFFPPVTGG